MKIMNTSEAFKSTSTMKHMPRKKFLGNELLRIEYSQQTKAPMRLLPGTISSHADGLSTSKQGKVESVFSTMNRLAKGKLSLGAKILQIGRAEKVFRRVFSVKEGEELLKASTCCLSTTSGPIAGRLFISTDKLAFCSDKPIARINSSSGQPLTFYYKVVIPLRKINRTNQSENVKDPSQKYLQAVTADDFEFWFMGFVNYKRTFKCLQQALS